jgi:DNA-binding NtrC family response regulator
LGPVQPGVSENQKVATEGGCPVFFHQNVGKRGKYMSSEHATVIEPEHKGRNSKSSQSNGHLRLAERPVHNRIDHLVELAGSLLQEAEVLAQDRVFAEQSRKSRSLDFSRGIDFYDEVTQFETGLIKMALERTGGNQAKAAQLLRIKPTTLNSKIKLYKIDVRC